MKRVRAFPMAITFGAVVMGAALLWAAPPPGKGPAGGGPGMRHGPGMAANDDDKRTPVPLLPMMANHQKANMRDHLAAIQEILTGLSAHDLAAVEKASARLGTTEEMTRMCNHMGAGAPGFTDVALNFHHTADGIGEAARAKDEAAVLKAVNATLSTCVSCHATYKQQVVDRDTWEKLTKMKAPGPPR